MNDDKILIIHVKSGEIVAECDDVESCNSFLGGRQRNNMFGIEIRNILNNDIKSGQKSIQGYTFVYKSEYKPKHKSINKFFEFFE